MPATSDLTPLSDAAAHAGAHGAGAWRPRVREFVARRFGLVAALGYALMALALYWRGLASTLFLYGPDIYTHDYMMHLYGWGEILELGRLPLWCPFLFCGTPFIATLGICPFYPSQWLFAVVPHNAAFTLQFAAAVAVGGGLFCWWMRVLGLSRLVAFWGGAAFLLSGHLLTLSYAGHMTKMMAIAWVPLALLAVHLLIRALAGLAPRQLWGRDAWRPGLRPGLLLAAALTMMSLACHLQILYGTVLLCAVTLLCGAAARPPFAAGDARPISPRRQVLLRLAVAGGYILWLAAACAAAALFAAIQMFPTLEVAADSNRSQGLTFVDATLTSYPPAELAEFVLPRAFGDSVPGTELPYAGSWGSERLVSDFLGMPLLMLALIGLLRATGLLRWLLAAVAAAGVAVALGRHTPVYQWLFEFLPGFRQFRSPGTFLFLTTTALVALATMGLESLRRRRLKWRPWLAVVLAMLTVAGIAAAIIGVERNWGVRLEIAAPEEAARYHNYRNLLVFGAHLALTAGAGLVLLLSGRVDKGVSLSQGLRPIVGLGRTPVAALAALTLLLLAVHNRHFVRFEPLAPYRSYLYVQPHYAVLRTAPERPLRLRHWNALKLDHILHQIGAPTAYHPIELGRYERLKAAMDFTGTPFADLFAIRYAVTQRRSPPDAGWTLEREMPAQSVWKRAAGATPYARGGLTLIEAEDGAEAVRLVADTQFDPARLAIAEKSDLARAAAAAGPQGVLVRAVNWAGHRVEVQVDGRRGGVLGLAEVYAPGWKAWSDAGELAVLPLNHAQVGIVVPEGTLGAIVAEYEPASYRFGLLITSVSLMLVWCAHLRTRGRAWWRRRRGALPLAAGAAPASSGPPANVEAELGELVEEASSGGFPAAEDKSRDPDTAVPPMRGAGDEDPVTAD